MKRLLFVTFLLLQLGCEAKIKMIIPPPFNPPKPIKSEVIKWPNVPRSYIAGYGESGWYRQLDVAFNEAYEEACIKLARNFRVKLVSMSKVTLSDVGKHTLIRVTKSNSRAGIINIKIYHHVRTRSELGVSDRIMVIAKRSDIRWSPDNKLLPKPPSKRLSKTPSSPKRAKPKTLMERVDMKEKNNAVPKSYNPPKQTTEIIAKCSPTGTVRHAAETVTTRPKTQQANHRSKDTIEILQRLNSWARAWQRKNLRDYMSHYADFARIERVTVVGNGKVSVKLLSKLRLKLRMKRLFKKYGWISLSINSPEITFNGRNTGGNQIDVIWHPKRN